jgi:hypothetical protein
MACSHDYFNPGYEEGVNSWDCLIFGVFARLFNQALLVIMHAVWAFY